MSWVKATIPFSLLPQPRHRWGVFATSFGLQSTGMVLLALLAASAPRVAQSQFVELIAPGHLVWQQPVTEIPVAAPKPMARREPIVPRFAAPVLPSPVAVLAPKVLAKAPIQAGPVPREVLPAQQEAPRVQRRVQINDFGRSITPTLPSLAPRQVQTGGFGDPNGVARSDQSKSGKAVVIAAAGGFDLPAGSGYGNGSAGARGLRGVIPSVGFGDATGTDAPLSPKGRVQATSFEETPSEIKQLAPSPSARKPAIVPVAIHEKPNPLYTREARELRVEGEVLLEVLFTSDGRVQVLRVMRGLGHGLDEAAVQAAQGIRFTPAKREGQAVDTTATVHIVFQLS